MGCYEDHLLLAYMDGELKSESMAVESHLQECDECQARLRALADDEQYLEGVLSDHLEEIELGHAFKQESWIRFKLQLSSTPKQKLAGVSPGRKVSSGIGRAKVRLGVAAAVVLLLIGSLALGSVRSALADLLSVFRADTIETISLQDKAQMDEALKRGIERIDIDNIGTFRVKGSEENIPDCTLAEAGNNLGFKILKPDMQGYGEPHVSVKKHPSQSLTLNVPGINEAIKKLGGTHLLPQELDLQTVTLNPHPQVFLNYQSSSLPSVSMVQARNPELEVPGNVKAEAVRDALLSLPFWPEGIRQQLAGINDWRHTMVIPETALTQPVTVRGYQGITWNNGADSASTTVIWSENGIIYSINGQLPLERILEIAEGMK